LVVGFFFCLLLLGGVTETLVTAQLAARGVLSARTVRAVHVVNIALELLLPVALVLRFHPVPVVSFVSLFNVVIVWMKLISYVAVNEVSVVVVVVVAYLFAHARAPVKHSTSAHARRPQPRRTTSWCGTRTTSL
jgi:hypothetical protein